jgi:hypothetical protein
MGAAITGINGIPLYRHMMCRQGYKTSILITVTNHGKRGYNGIHTALHHAANVIGVWI